MPALYAHNKFGKLVLKNMSPTLKKIIKKYPRAYRLGLQGPDLLFFYRPFYKNHINQFGSFIHKHDAYDFFLNAAKIVKTKTFDNSCHAYILGYLCHFVLDANCHPYVNHIKNTYGCGHIELEGDLEHLLLTKDGHTPHKFPMHKLVPTDSDTLSGLKNFYPEISQKDLHIAMIYMKKTKKLFVAPGILKRNTIDLLMRASLHYKSVKGHVVFPWSNRKYRQYTLELYSLLINTVPKANRMIEQFELSMQHNIPLPDSFHYDFNGTFHI